jgi:hypothetical protein
MARVDQLLAGGQKSPFGAKRIGRLGFLLGCERLAVV